MTTYTIDTVEQYIDAHTPLNYRGDNDINYRPFDRSGFIATLNDSDNSFVQFMSQDQTLICEFERVDTDTWVLSKQQHVVGQAIGEV